MLRDRHWNRVKGRKQGLTAPSGKGDKDQKKKEKTWRLLRQGRTTWWKSWQSSTTPTTAGGWWSSGSGFTQKRPLETKPNVPRSSCTCLDCCLSLQITATTAARSCTARLGTGLGIVLENDSVITSTMSSQPQHQGHGGHHVRRSWWPREGLPGGQAGLDTVVPVEEWRDFSSLPDKTFGMISVLGYGHVQSRSWTIK